jgi:hypothetical protein
LIVFLAMLEFLTHLKIDKIMRKYPTFYFVMY